jgi:hypothetical protein
LRKVSTAAAFALVAFGALAGINRLVGMTACAPASDAGAGDAAAATGTVQDQCTKIWTAFCQDEPSCAISESISQCVTDKIAGSGCCVGASQCNAAAKTPDTYITACVTDMKALVPSYCYQVSNIAGGSYGMVPTSCQGLPQVP